MQKARGIFESGERGMVCRKPKGGGPWLILDRRSRQPKVGVDYVVEVIGTSASGKVRFVRLLETVEEETTRLRKEMEPLILDSLGRAYPEDHRHMVVDGRYIRFDYKGASFFYEAFSGLLSLLDKRNEEWPAYNNIGAFESVNAFLVKARTRADQNAGALGLECWAGIASCIINDVEPSDD